MLLFIQMYYAKINQLVIILEVFSLVKHTSSRAQIAHFEFDLQIKGFRELPDFKTERAD